MNDSTEASAQTRRRRPSIPRWRMVTAAMAILVGSLMLAACGSSSTSGTSSGASAASSSAGAASSTPVAAGQCGSNAPIGPSNSSGVFASLSPTLKTLFGGYPFSLNASPYEHVKKKGPWKIGFIGYPPINGYFVGRYAALQSDFAAAKAKGLVTGSLVTSIPGTVTDLTPQNQIAAIEQMVHEGVDLIMIEPASAAAEESAIDAAGAAGVVVLSTETPLPGGSYAQSILANDWAQSSAQAGPLIKSGDVLIVRGIQGNSVDDIEYDQTVADFKRCPGIKIVGSVYGDYDDATTKTAVQQFLTSHPQPLAGVVSYGTGGGTVAAFQAAGRPVPKLFVTTPLGGFMSYWNANKSSIDAVAQGFTGAQVYNAVFDAALRIMDGKGPKYSVIMFPGIIYNNQNLSKYAPANQALTSSGSVLSGGQNTLCEGACMNKFFNQPGSPMSGS